MPVTLATPADKILAGLLRYTISRKRLPGNAADSCIGFEQGCVAWKGSDHGSTGTGLRNLKEPLMENTMVSE